MGNPQIKVKEYKNSKEFEKDAVKMLKAGWEIQHQSEKKGNVSVGTTARNLMLTGGIGWLIGGRAHLDDKVAVTWTRGGMGATALPDGTASTYSHDVTGTTAAGRRTKLCPQCAESVMFEAKICRFCRFEFPEPSVGEAAPQTEFSVVLFDGSHNKIRVIKAIRDITHLGLKEAKDLVDDAPKTVVEKLGWDEAQAIKARLEQAGGRADLR